MLLILSVPGDNHNLLCSWWCTWRKQCWKALE